MQLFPAIPICAGNYVRLYQGDYAKETVYGDDPVAQARTFAAAGAPLDTWSSISSGALPATAWIAW